MNFPILRFQIPKDSWGNSPRKLLATTKWQVHTAKSKNKIPQKTKIKCHKKPKQNTTKNQNRLAVSLILRIFAPKLKH